MGCRYSALASALAEARDRAGMSKDVPGHVSLQTYFIPIDYGDNAGSRRNARDLYQADSVSAICLKILRYFNALQDCPYAHPYIYPYIRLSDDAAGRWHLTPEGKSVMLLLADQILDKAIRA